MKSFYESKKGDTLYILTSGEEDVFFEREITDVFHDKNCVWINTSWDSYMITDCKDKDFMIVTYIIDDGLQEAIATSMDRLLLECEEIMNV